MHIEECRGEHHGLKQLVDIKLVEMKETFNTFRALLGIKWFAYANRIVDLGKDLFCG